MAAFSLKRFIWAIGNSLVSSMRKESLIKLKGFIRDILTLEEAGYINTRRLLRFFLFSVIFFLFIFGSVFVVLMRWSDQIQLPNLQNQEIMESIRKLQKLKLQPHLIIQASKEIPAYKIISQSPEPGIFVKPGRKIRLIVSSGEKRGTMPELVGQNYYEAKIDLLELFSTFEAIPNIIERRKYSEEITKDFIIEQSPPAGTRINPDENLILTVSRGIISNEIQLPNYRWQNYKDVVTELEEVGITVTYRTRETSAKSKVGKIIAQSVEPGKKIKNGDKIGFLIGVARSFDETAKEIYHVYSLKVPYRNHGEKPAQDFINVFPSPDANAKYSPSTLAKLRRVALVVEDSLGREKRFDELVYAGSYVDLPYKSMGNGNLTVYLDGEFYDSVRFD